MKQVVVIHFTRAEYAKAGAGNVLRLMAVRLWTEGGYLYVATDDPKVVGTQEDGFTYVENVHFEMQHIANFTVTPLPTVGRD